ncbi:uncharacterized protein [Argopecten irradians]|uniref:uncharacterized protein n=1 Tax=Argopecten irradians TaxID=31199 RepID=UPI00371DE2B8
MNQKPDTVHVIVLACLCLHNITRVRYSADQNLLMDQEDVDQQIIPAAWRDGVDMGDVQLGCAKTLKFTSCLFQLDIVTCFEHDCKMDEMCVATASGDSCVKHGLSTVRCPSGSAQYHDICVWPVMGNYTWYEAQTACGEGASLLEISTVDIYNLFETVSQYRCSVKRCPYPRSFWIGLKYSATHSAFVWDASGKILTPTDFNTFLTFPTPGNTDMCFGLYRQFKSNTTRTAQVDCDCETMVACQLIAPDYWT